MKKEKMKIRKATKKDFLEYLRLKREEEVYFAKLLDKRFSISDIEYKKEFLSIFKTKKNVLLVAEQTDKLIGFLYGIFFKSLYDQSGFIEVIYVSRDYRRERVATKLMKEFTKMVKNKGLEKIQLSVNVKNVEALEFYKKIGYELHHYNLKKELR